MEMVYSIIVIIIGITGAILIAKELLKLKLYLKISEEDNKKWIKKLEKFVDSLK